MIPLSRGMFICDICDTATDHAREVAIFPKEEKVEHLPKGTKIASAHLAFCPRCATNEESMLAVIQKAADEVNKWLESTTK